MEICDKENELNIDHELKRLDWNENLLLLKWDTVKENKKSKFTGAIILMLAVFAGSWMGPLFNMYGEVNPFLKNLWRNQLNIIFTLPFVIYSAYYNPEWFDWDFIQYHILIKYN